MTPTDDESRRKILVAAFRLPQFQNMLSRKSSITNAFVTSVLPVIRPTIEEIDQALQILGLDPTDCRCAYCGDKSSEWDHLRPLVIKRRPTGFVTEIANLVPACGKCNQSKGNKPWREWMLGKADRSPTRRGLANVAERVARLEAFEQWRPPTKLDFALIVGEGEWESYWSMCEKVIDELKECHKVSEVMRKRIIESLGPENAFMKEPN
jgi:5-methylcytosine-specific restriction endonuclease McrA